jgi:TonB family protein
MIRRDVAILLGVAFAHAALLWTSKPSPRAVFAPRVGFVEVVSSSEGAVDRSRKRSRLAEEAPPDQRETPVAGTSAPHLEAVARPRAESQEGRPDVTEVSAAELAAWGNEAPTYPEDARQQLAQGVVVIDVAVDPRGEARKVVLRHSAGHASLDDAVLRSAARWRFPPGGGPYRFRVKFALEQ